MTVHRSVKTETETKWEDIEKYAHPTEPGWIFRGQRSADWELQTSLERCCDRHEVDPEKRAALESRLLRDFRRVYHHYGRHIPNQNAAVEWLSLMQHFGAPTRLLDFTYSIYVATYFATEAADGDSAVWAVDGPWAMSQAAALLRAVKSHATVALMMEYFDERAEETISGLFFEKPYACATWPISAFRLNERLRIQQGVFMIPGDITGTFMSNLMALLTTPDAQDHVLKIIIPREVGRKAIRHLYSMGMSRTNLFPGLDGYAQSLNVWHSAFDPVDWKRYEP